MTSKSGTQAPAVPPKTGTRPRVVPLLPATDLHHSLPVAWFALSCLIADLTRHRKAR